MTVTAANGCARADLATIKASAQGRWQEILPAVAGIDAALLDGKGHPCPRCGGTDRFSAFGDFNETGAVICRHCHFRANGDGLAAIQWATGFDFGEAIDRVADHLGLSGAPVATNTPKPPEKIESVAVATPRSVERGRILEAYDYCDEQGDLVFQAVRLEPKDFRQRRPDGDGWAWGVKGLRVLPYHLPELLSDPEALVFVVEGEKDVHSLESIDLVATTNAGGASKWKAEHSGFLAGRNVVILPDNDDPGRTHALKTAESLSPVAESVKVVHLPGLPDKGDVTDWIDGHGDAAVPEVISDNLLELIANTNEYQSAKELAAETSQNDLRKPVLCHRPFPVGVLPDTLQRFVCETAEAVQVDPSMVALPVLVGCAAAVGATRQIAITEDWIEPPILWAATVSPSGTGKTPASQKALEPIRRRDSDSQKQNDREQSEYLGLLENYKAEQASYRKQKNKASISGPVKPDRPAVIRCAVSDITIEALAEVLADNPDGVLCERDELSGLLGGMDRYSNGKGGAERAAYLSVWSADRISITRKTGERRTITVERPHVSLYGGIQPDLLHSLVDDMDVASGLPARFLFSLPPTWPRKLSSKRVSESTKSDYRRLVDCLFALEPESDDEDGFIPKTVTLNDEALDVFRTFHDRVAVEVSEGHGPVTGALSKLQGYAARLALVIHCCRERQGDLPLGDDLICDTVSMSSAVALADWFANEARRVFDRRSETPVDRDKRELVEWIARHGGETTSRDLSRGPRQYRSRLAAETALNDLAKSGVGEWEVVSTTTIQKRVFRLQQLATVTD